MKRAEDSSLFLNKLSTIQKRTATSVGELTMFVKDTFIIQDKVNQLERGVRRNERQTDYHFGPGF